MPIQVYKHRQDAKRFREDLRYVGAKGLLQHGYLYEFRWPVKDDIDYVLVGVPVHVSVVAPRHRPEAYAVDIDVCCRNVRDNDTHTYCSRCIRFWMTLCQKTESYGS